MVISYLKLRSWNSCHVKKRPGVRGGERNVAMDKLAGITNTKSPTESHSTKQSNKLSLNSETHACRPAGGAPASHPWLHSALRLLSRRAIIHGRPQFSGLGSFSVAGKGQKPSQFAPFFCFRGPRRWRILHIYKHDVPVCVAMHGTRQSDLILLVLLPFVVSSAWQHGWLTLSLATCMLPR